MGAVSHLLSAPTPKQEGIVLSAPKTIAVDASGARVLPDTSRAAEFKNIKAFFVKKLQTTSPSNTSSRSPRMSETAARGKEENK
jgi:hypothetical protein